MSLILTALILYLARTLPRYVSIPLVVLLASAVFWYFFLRPAPDRRLPRRRLLITGGAGGVGRALALRAASRAAASVELWDIDGGALQAAVDEVRAAHPACAVRGVVVDVCDEAAVTAKLGEGAFDAFIHCAVEFGATPLVDTTGPALARALAVNVGGALALIRAAIRAGVAAKAAAAAEAAAAAAAVAVTPAAPTAVTPAGVNVVLVSSTMGWLGASRLGDYCASKWALGGLADVARQEINADALPVGVHLVCPYIISTTLFSGALETPPENAGCAVRCAHRVTRVLVRKLTPEVVADAILDGLVFSNGRHKTAFLPFITRILALAPRLILSPSLDAFDWVIATVGGSWGMRAFAGKSHAAKPAARDDADAKGDGLSGSE